LSLSISAVTSAGSVGSVTVQSSESDTGTVATGSVGAVSIAVSTTLSGVTGTGSVGAITTTNSQSLSGVTGTGTVGSVTVQRSESDTGTTATGSVGVVSITVTPSLSSVTSTGSVGSLTVNTAEADTGTTATGSVGSISNALNIALSGTAATGLVGSVNGPNKNFALTGVITEQQVPYYGWNTFGNTSFAALAPNGTQPLGCSVGDVIATPVTYITLDGVTGNGSAGNINVNRELNALTGVVTSQQQVSYYSWNTFADASFASIVPNVTQFIGCSVGDITVTAGIALSSVTSTGSAGTIASVDKLFSLLGVKGYGKVGNVLVKPHWEKINDASGTNWVPIDTNNGNGWSTISDNSNTTWATIDTDSGSSWSTIDDAQPVDWQLVTTEDA
jgi:hypothetical protein